MPLRIDPIADADDLEWCARLMASNEPWITLRRDLTACRAALANRAKERYVVRHDEERVGLLLLDMTGPFPGYIQSICIAAAARNRGFGAELLAWAERRILRDSPNVFMCVSSFNPGALRLYRRLGYDIVGTLKGFVVDEHDEYLLQKRHGSWESFRASKARIESSGSSRDH
jgi:ribosomal protein S18 acetylase RimI-like enzyme